MNSRQGCLLLSRMIISAVVSILFLSGCASGRKQKLEQREKLAASSGLYCDFVNGDKNKEVELELNVLMSKKCDADRPFSITNYKTPAEVTGVLYCCGIKKAEVVAKAPEAKPAAAPAPAPKAEPAKPTSAPPAVAPAKAPTPAPAPEKKEVKPQENRGDLDGEVSL